MSRPKIKVYDGTTAYKYASLKRDGIWLTVTLTPRADLETSSQAAMQVKIETRNPTDVTHVLHRHPVFEALEYAKSPQVWYCELFATNGEPASIVKHYMASGALDKLSVEAFASPTLPLGESLSILEHCANTIRLPFVPWAPCAWPHWKEDYPTAEGLIFQDGNLLNWAKLKRIATIDTVVIGAKEGNGKYLGLVGALRVAVEGYEVAAVSGMEDSDRIEMGEMLERNELVGKVAEVAFQYVGAKGRLRHPRFVRWRDDKRPDECLLSQDEDLKAYYERKN